MCLICDEAVRDQISLSLAAVPELIPELSQQKMNLERVDALCQVLIAENRASIADTIWQQIGDELSIAYFGIIVTGIMAFTIEHDTTSPVLPPDWISLDGIPNPDLILAKMLVNVTNYALSVITLVESGLESQARTNLRNFLEHTWLTIVTLAKQEKMSAYVQGVNEEAERKLYYKHFTPKKLRDSLIELETDTGIPEVARQALSSTRSSLYSYYSKTVHGAYSDLVVGAMGFSFEDNKLRSSLFGRADRASYPTLYHLNDALFYFLAMIKRILSQIHSIKPPYTVEWQKVLAMHESFEYVIGHRSKKRV